MASSLLPPDPERLLRAVVDCSQAAIFALDRELRYLAFNHAHAATMRTLYGVEISPAASYAECLTVAEDRAQALADLERALRGESVVSECQRGDSSHARRSYTLAHDPLRSQDGAVTGVVVVAQDVTERKRAERAVHGAEQHLVLSQRMEAVARLAGGVAHDFNNLLSVILGHSEGLLKELEPDDPRRSRLNTIVSAAKHAAGLTRQLLAFGRRQVLEPRLVRLDRLVGESRKLLEQVAGDHVALHVARPEALGWVRADPGQMIEVLLSLTASARDSMPGGGQLTVEFADTELDEAYCAAHPPCQPGRYVLMAVSDTGAGMDRATSARVFEPFFTTKPEGPATGLGLATAYGIVKQSGGYVWAYSELGVGSTFKVYLPRVEDPSAAEASPAPPRAPATGGRILLVEDDDNVRELMVELLEVHGHSIRAFGRPHEALEQAIADGPYDLLVTDVIMPRMSGGELARRLLEKQPGLRVLYVSGYAGEALTRHGGLQRGEHFLQKPFSAAGFLDAVSEALSRPTPQG